MIIFAIGKLIKKKYVSDYQIFTTVFFFNFKIEKKGTNTVTVYLQAWWCLFHFFAKLRGGGGTWL